MAFPVGHVTTGQLVTASLLSEWADNQNLLKTSVRDDGSVYGPLKGYHETYQAVTISAGVINVNFALGNHVIVPFTANVTAITYTNGPATNVIVPIMVYYVADGTARTSTHIVNTNTPRYPGGSAPTMTATTGKIDRILYTVVQGLYVLVDVVAQNQ